MRCPRRQGKECRKVPAGFERCSTLCPRLVRARVPELPARFHLKYIMVGPARTIVALDTRKTRELIRWARWFETADRKIARTEIGECVIRTVFLGMYHGLYDEGPPILFESMVFALKEDYGSDIYMERYATLAEAQAGHARIVAHIRRHANDAEATAEHIIKHLCARRPEEMLERTHPVCILCEEPITDADEVEHFNTTVHKECALRSVCGSVAHVQKRCGCFIPGSTETDPEGMTRREAARWAVAALRVAHYGEQLLNVEHSCPLCGCAAFNPGPRGGAARNIRCAMCRAQYLYSPPFTPMLIFSADDVYNMRVTYTLPFPEGV